MKGLYVGAVAFSALLSLVMAALLFIVSKRQNGYVGNRRKKMLGRMALAPLMQFFVTSILLFRMMAGAGRAVPEISGCFYFTVVPFVLADRMRVSRCPGRDGLFSAVLIASSALAAGAVFLPAQATVFKIAALTVLAVIAVRAVVVDFQAYIDRKDRSGLAEVDVCINICIALAVALTSDISPIIVLASESLVAVLALRDKRVWMQEVEREGGGGMSLDESVLSDDVTDDEMDQLMMLADRLVKYLDQSKLYLDPDIRVSDIATSLSTNKTYLSRAISRTMHQNFSQVVHKMRIRAAVSIIENEPNVSLNSLCSRCGFRSMSSFNNAFKFIMGATPGEWRRVYTINNYKDEGLASPVFAKEQRQGEAGG